MTVRITRMFMAVLVIMGTYGELTRVFAESLRPRNVIFVICDQETYQLAVKGDYQLPARQTLMRHGVTFRNHYIASAMCSPSRASLLCGQPPQVTGIFDNMGYDFVPSLDPARPNMGSVMKSLGYRTVYFGKFEMDHKLLVAQDSTNYKRALQPYGFDVFSAVGDVPSGPREGYNRDCDIAAQGVSWLRSNAVARGQTGAPFFMILSFLNPHDIMYANANLPGQAPVQKAVTPGLMPPIPPNAQYQKSWEFALSPSLSESLSAPGMPPAIAAYQKGWSAVLGSVPNDRNDMWRQFYNYYLNCIQDNDRILQQVVNALDEMDLWKDTIVVLSADHGEMGGAHGGLKGKGPFSYEANAHVPLIIAHPDAKPGTHCAALTSHLDLLPTFVGFTGIPDAQEKAGTARLPGHDFSALLTAQEDVGLHAIRPAVLFNYVGLITVDADYLTEIMGGHLLGKHDMPPLSQIRRDKKGFLSFVFDGRYKFARYYAPNAFNVPKTWEQIVQHNDIQLFDLKSDPDEMRNLALEPDRNRETILKMNAMLNDLMAKEVGVNDGRFLPAAVRPTRAPLTF